MKKPSLPISRRSSAAVRVLAGRADAATPRTFCWRASDTLGGSPPREGRLCTPCDKLVSRLPPLDLVSNSAAAHNILGLKGFWRIAPAPERSVAPLSRRG